MRRRIVFLLALLLGGAPALADVTLHYAPDGQSLTGVLIQADDHGHIRATTEIVGGLPDSRGLDILIDGDEVFLLQETPNGPALARLEDALALARESAAMRRRGAPPPAFHMRATAHGGERVAAWNGDLYWLDREPPDPASRAEVVVSNDPALLPYAAIALRAMAVQGRLVAAIFGLDNGENERVFTEVGSRGLLLRQAQVYRLESVSTDPVPAERFARPGPVLTRDQLRALHAAD